MELAAIGATRDEKIDSAMHVTQAELGWNPLAPSQPCYSAWRNHFERVAFANSDHAKWVVHFSFSWATSSTSAEQSVNEARAADSAEFDAVSLAEIRREVRAGVKEGLSPIRHLAQALEASLTKAIETGRVLRERVR